MIEAIEMFTNLQFKQINAPFWRNKITVNGAIKVSLNVQGWRLFKKK